MFPVQAKKFNLKKQFTCSDFLPSAHEYRCAFEENYPAKSTDLAVIEVVSHLGPFFYIVAAIKHTFLLIPQRAAADFQTY